MTVLTKFKQNPNGNWIKNIYQSNKNSPSRNSTNIMHSRTVKAPSKTIDSQTNLTWWVFHSYGLSAVALQTKSSSNTCKSAMMMLARLQTGYAFSLTDKLCHGVKFTQSPRKSMASLLYVSFLSADKQGRRTLWRCNWFGHLNLALYTRKSDGRWA